MNINKRIKFFHTDIPRNISRNASMYQNKRLTRAQEEERQRYVNDWALIGIVLVAIICLTSFTLAFGTAFPIEIKKIGQANKNQIGY